MNNIFQIIRKYPTILFLSILFIFFFLLNFYHILFLPPQGLHFIRQTDSLSFVLNYISNGYNFFEPQVYNLKSLNGRAASEFPILYYLTALLYYVIGEKEYILRSITLLITTCGFVFLYKMIKDMLNDLFYTIVITFLLISSTTLLFYTNNFLPDTSALGFTLIAWYYFYRFLKHPDNYNYAISSFLLFTIGALLKAVYIINPTAAILSLLIFSFKKHGFTSKIIHDNWKCVLFFIGSVTVVASWYYYVSYYNDINRDSYFLISTHPISWHSKNEAIQLFSFILDYWKTQYYYATTWHLFIVLILTGFIFIKYSNFNIIVPSILLTIGGLIYIMLFFIQFRDHDYYFITIIPALIFLICNSIVTLKTRFPK
jgi:4-amino-4-deoxy-L-arabinose transferase-like glycosyltransferase